MSYSAISDLENRYDVRILGDLVSDNNTRVTNLTGNTILQALLDSAAGEINMACLVGERYTEAQLSGLTGVDQQILFDIEDALAFEKLRLRRGLPLEGYPQIEQARKMLQLIREGHRVFASLPQEGAGLTLDVFPPLQYFVNLNLLRDNVTGNVSRGYFTPRRVQQN
jgi:hypothetical protein